MAGLTRGKLMIVGSVLVILILVMLFVNFVMPLQKERKGLTNKLEQRKDELQTLLVKLESAGKLSDEQKWHLSQIRKKLPEEPYQELLIRDLRMYEVVSGLKFTNYMFNLGNAPQVREGDEGLSKAVPLQFSTNVEGKYDQFYRFLEELETNGRMMHVEQISFSTPVTPPISIHLEDQIIKSNLTLTAYYVPELKAWYKQPLPIGTEPLGTRQHPLQ